MSTPFLGEIKIVSYNFAMNGWALCNGQLLAINQNQALFSILGTTYGGNGTTTFALPNFQGMFPMHAGQGAGLTAVTIGQAKGAGQIALQASNLPVHTHALNASTGAPTTHDPTGAALATLPRSSPPIYAHATANAALSAQSVASAGAGQPFPCLQPYAVFNFVIALQGIFPSRN